MTAHRVIYRLPHKFTVETDPVVAGAFMLMCNGKFAFGAETIEEIFVAYGQHLSVTDHHKVED